MRQATELDQLIHCASAANLDIVQFAAELCELLVEENFGELFGVRLRPATCWLEILKYFGGGG